MPGALPGVPVVPAVGVVVQALSVPNAAKAAMVKPNRRCLDGAVMIVLLKNKGLV